MRIKDPVLVAKQEKKVYEVDVEGTKVMATYEYDMDNEQASGWDYDLTPCCVDLTEDEVLELEDDFYGVLCGIKQGE